MIFNFYISDETTRMHPGFWRELRDLLPIVDWRQSNKSYVCEYRLHDMCQFNRFLNLCLEMKINLDSDQVQDFVIGAERAIQKMRKIVNCPELPRPYFSGTWSS